MYKGLNGFKFQTKKYGECYFDVARYGNERLALQVLNEEGPITVITVNLPDSPQAENEIFIKTWEGNGEILPDVLTTGLFTDTGRRAAGFVKAPIWVIND
jgi:hypothetical protein